MASNAAVIGALQVILGGDASALDKVLKGAQASVASFAKNVSSIAGGIGLEKAISGTIEKVVSTIKGGLDDVAKSAKGAQVTGTAVDDFTKLRYAAEVSGVSLEGLSGSLTELSSNMVSAAQGAAVPATEAFSKMGLSVKNNDGTLKTSSEMLGEIADKFTTYRDNAGKAALAQTLFGEKGAELIPLLNRGRDGIAELGDEAKKYGLVLDGETQFAVQSLNQNLQRMDAIKQGLALTIAAKLLPTFEQFSSAMLSAKEDATLMNAAADGLATIIKGVGSVALQSTVIISRLAAEVQALYRWATSPIGTGQWDAYLAEGQKTKEVLEALKGTVVNLWSDPNTSWDRQAFLVKMMNAEVIKLGENIKKTKDAPGGTADAERNALQVFLDSQAKRTAGVDAEAAAVGRSAGEQAKLRVEMEADAIVKARHIKLDDDMRDSITKAGNAAAAAAQRLQAANLTQDNLAPQQQRNLLLQQYVDLLNAGKISYDTFSLAAMKVQFPSFSAAARSAQDFQLQVDQLATNSLNSLASTIAAVATGTKEAGAAFKAFAVQMVADLIAMIAKAVIFKIIMAAIGFAGGGPVGSEATSFAAGITPMAGGGPIAGAGTGTSDSIVIAASDGEFMVNASSTKKYRPLIEAINADNLPKFAGGGMISARVSAANTNLSAREGSSFHAVPVVSKPRDVTLNVTSKIGREWLREVIDGLNAMGSDGYRLKLAA